MRDQPLPLLLLTGFLGSGKTSTLQHWLSATTVPLKRVAVIINDFGEVNVDAALLQRRQLELRSITGGCVCCQSFEDLVEQIAKLADSPAFDLVWIETSGLADPEEVLDHLSGAALQDRTVLRRVIIVIDATDYPCSWRSRAVQEEQVRYADLLLLNKTDRVDAAARLRVEIELRKLNPAAEIVSTAHGIISPERLSGEGTTAHLHAHDHDCGHDHAHHDHEHAHDAAVLPHAAATIFLPLPEPVERSAFTRFLASMPASVFRAKGFVRFVEEPGRVHTFQQVRDQAELLLLPLDDELEISSGLVLIGPQLDERALREQAVLLRPGQPVSS